MRVIIVYDIDVKRVAKVCKCLRKWLNWVQNSVFEGEVTAATLRQIKADLATIIDENQDSVLIYIIPAGARLTREVLGVEKLGTSNII
jgi:CRISPR-associated protein Cas2